MRLLKTNISNKSIVAISGLLILAIGLFYLYKLDNKQQQTVITTEKVSDVSRGRIIKGFDQSKDQNVLSTTSELEFLSEEIKVKNPKTTAAVLNWTQSGSAEGVHVKLRTWDGQNWSSWLNSETDDRPDSAPIPHSAIIISKDIQRVQYKLELHGSQDQPPVSVDLSQASVETIDTSRGPSIGDKTLWQRLIGTLGLQGKAEARTNELSPRIYSRAEWGSPEATSSPRWEPEYRTLGRAIVHHTATTATADSAAAIRAIWQYHANSRGWGDIGYNYLVDQQGRIFQGRYFDHDYANQNNVDVVAGHAYGNNYGTTGIAVLGDFTNVTPSGESLNSTARMAAYKLGAYNVDPGAGSNIVGHRDVGQTACPGAQLYPQLPTIRAIASGLFPQYQIRPFTWQYSGQFAYTDETKTTPVNLMNTSFGQRVYVRIQAKNIGTEPWYNTGPNPVVLGTSRPQDRMSGVCDDTWLRCNRPTLLKEAVVNVGETGSFEFWYKMPAMGGNTTEYFNLIAEGSMWMNDPGQHFSSYSFPPKYEWSIKQRSYFTDETKTTPTDPAVMEPGERIFVSIVAENTGDITWTNNGSNPMIIGTDKPRDRMSGFCDSSWVNCTRPTLLKEASVANGEDGSFEFWYESPIQPGNYSEWFSLLSEGKTWVGGTDINISSTVYHPDLNVSHSSRLIVDEQMGTGQSITSTNGKFRLIMQSDGNLVLYSPSRATWHTSTQQSGSNRLIMQSDGNLVLYSPSRATWHTSTAARGQSFLTIQNDGNLVIYNNVGVPIWNSGTNGRE